MGGLAGGESTHKLARAKFRVVNMKRGIERKKGKRRSSSGPKCATCSSVEKNAEDTDVMRRLANAHVHVIREIAVVNTLQAFKGNAVSHRLDVQTAIKER